MHAKHASAGGIVRGRPPDTSAAAAAEARALAQMSDEFECADMARRCDGFLAGPMAMAAVRMECSRAPPSRAVDWAVLADRCGLWGFLSKWETLLIDDWQVRAERPC